MNKQVLLIGLGQFGMSVLKSLKELEVDVLAVDRRQDLVNAATEYASEALCFDASEEQALAKTAPRDRDVCICAIGNEARESSILCTALLRQMGAPRVIARATDLLMERILKTVGAHEVFNPEREFGRRIASHIAHEKVLGEYRLTEGLSITELQIPPVFIGKSIAELNLPKKFGITIVGIQRQDQIITAPDPHAPLEQDDLLVVVSRTGAVAFLLDRVE